jgi:hypothetical protein
LKFLGEVWARRAWAGTNEEKFIKVLKSEGRRRKKAGGNNKKMEPAQGCGWQLAVTRQPQPCQTTQVVAFNFFKFLNFFWSFEEVPGILGEWVYTIPIFWSLPLHFELLNLPFLMELGDFIFFQKKNSKIRGLLDLPIHCWDFSLMK